MTAQTKTPKSHLRVRLIALDLDDTLLNSDRQISEENIRALQRAAALGIYVVLCSGRAEQGILPFVRALNIAGTEAGRYLVAVNGCSVFDLHTRLQIYSRNVSGDVLRLADSRAREMGLDSEVYSSDTAYYRRETPWILEDVVMCRLKGVVVPDYDSFLDKGFPKMLIPGESEKLQILQSRLKAELGERAVIFTSKPYFLEILPPGCGKGEALRFLASRLGISIEETLCFGDSMNDEDMFRKCGISVCMVNGLPAMKEIATFVTEKDNNQSGVGDFIEKYVL